MQKYNTRALLVAFLLSFAFSAHAQRTVQDVITAEKSFAAYASEHNLPAAFMRNLDSANAVDVNNSVVQKSYDKWSKRKPDSSRLTWQPAFAGIAKSGDLGFTTGPWEYRQAAGSAPVAAGEYVTVWHVNTKGEWKYLLDMGISFNPPVYKVDSITTWSGSYSDIGNDEPTAIDRSFTQQYDTKRNEAFKTALAPNAWFMLQGSQPIKGVENILASLAAMPNLQFIQTAGGISTAGDLAWVYGSVRNGADITAYLRIWQKTAAGFKILLQVVQ